MFAYYSDWISHFSDKIQILNQNITFPLPPQVLDSFERLKSELEEAVLFTVDPNLPLVVETDASDVAISATLNQEGRPVAFFSRTLTSSEKNHSSVEKEAYAIVEAVRKWRHYLLNSHFRLITDQRSVAFIYNCQHRGKVKNDQIQRWKIELSCYNYDVIYRQRPENQAADALSRATCDANSISNNLQEIKATQPFERLKGLSQIHRAPYDFRTRRLAVEFRDRAGPFRISFLRRSWSHIQRSPDDAR